MEDFKRSNRLICTESYKRKLCVIELLNNSISVIDFKNEWDMRIKMKNNEWAWA